MKYLKYILLVCLLIIDGYLLYQSSLDGYTSSQKSDVVTDVVIDAVDKVTDSNESVEEKVGREKLSLYVRKFFGHFGLFAINGILTVLVCYLFIKKRNLGIMLVVVHGLLISSMTEILQLFAKDREGTIKDVLIDCAGYIFGLIFIIIIYMIIKKIKTNKKEINYE